MAHIEQQNFCIKVKEKYPDYFKGKKILDIGSLDINGNNRGLFEDCVYIGIDIGEGSNVDIVSLGHLYDGPDNHFDTIISTEVFEHDMFYEKTICNIIRMLKPGGLFLFTCATTGRKEHGTKNTNTEVDAPFLLQQSEEWSNYYKNLIKEDFKKIPNFNITFPDGHFESNNFHNGISIDIYFYGIKGGSKYLTDQIVPEFNNGTFKDDIFVIDYWIDTESKENDLINLIKRLKIFNIPIMLTGHHPLKMEIQKMVDYYLYDKNNPNLIVEEYEKYLVNSVYWTDMGSYRLDNLHEFHHDYAIWETMRNAFNFCGYLGKKKIHFMEYDNLPEIIQYRQAFLERIDTFDAILFDYHKEIKKDPNLAPYCAAYIFSIKTDVAIKTIDLIKSKKEYFDNKPNGWNLERVFYDSLVKVTRNIHITEYIPNDGEFNTKAVWDRDGTDRNGAKFQICLAVDDDNELYIHFTSGFYGFPAEKEYLIETNYNDYKKFITLHVGEYITNNIGKYKKGDRVKAYHKGVEVYNEYLKYDVDYFRKLNKLTRKNTGITKTDEINKNKTVNINFIDGPYVEILEKETRTYHVQFINTYNNKIEHEQNFQSNQWVKASKKFYIEWLIRINGVDNDFLYEYLFDPTEKRFLISIESKSLGDTLSWIGQIEKFREKRKCIVICSTFHGGLFENQYPNIKFVKPGTVVHYLYGLYKIGYFYVDNNVNYNLNKTDPKKEPMIKVCTDILGLNFEEIKPKLQIHNVIKKKQISIAVYSTAQTKFWNNPNGWGDVTTYLKKRGYEVLLLSSEENGYMGNFDPPNVTRIPKGSLKNITKIISESELLIGVSSGLAWLSWSLNIPTIIICGFTDKDIEMQTDVHRVINEDVCHGCWSKEKFSPGDWNWCPYFKGTERQFECSKKITSDMVIDKIKLILGE